MPWTRWLLPRSLVIVCASGLLLMALDEGSTDPFRLMGIASLILVGMVLLIGLNAIVMLRDLTTCRYNSKRLFWTDLVVKEAMWLCAGVGLWFWCYEAFLSRYIGDSIEILVVLVPPTAFIALFIFRYTLHRVHVASGYFQDFIANKFAVAFVALLVSVSFFTLIFLLS